MNSCNQESVIVWLHRDKAMMDMTFVGFDIHPRRTSGWTQSSCKATARCFLLEKSRPLSTSVSAVGTKRCLSQRKVTLSLVLSLLSTCSYSCQIVRNAQVLNALAWSPAKESSRTSLRRNCHEKEFFSLWVRRTQQVAMSRNSILHALDTDTLRIQGYLFGCSSTRLLRTSMGTKSPHRISILIREEIESLCIQTLSSGRGKIAHLITNVTAHKESVAQSDSCSGLLKAQGILLPSHRQVHLRRHKRFTSLIVSQLMINILLKTSTRLVSLNHRLKKCFIHD